ncbi:MAG TPA: class I SAM-dependent methyltransferase [Candidatus Paceibacterota bacterium]|nr:class I SAM-dependent methyltransferase [Candidatus Paceibacterota bacterium]
MERILLTTKPQKDYELLDSGGEEKLERYGNVLLSRPDPQALWPKQLPEGEWTKANARYIREGNTGKWVGELPKEWPIELGNLKFLIRPTPFKHTGLFPEQICNWEWAGELIRGAGRPVSALNLFGYTGGASLAAAAAGASVVHVDASKTAVAWARENAELSGLADKPIRWITEDVKLFVERELKRGNRYDLILMDPPAFGHGPKDELWKIEEDLLPLIEACTRLLSETPVGMLVNGYAAGYSPLAFAYNLEPLAQKMGGATEYGDLTIEEKGSGRLLPCGIFARWRAKNL